MKRMSKLATALFAAVLLVCMTAASAFAMSNGTGVIDYENSKVTATGIGVAPPTAVSETQRRALARRAAQVDAYRQLVETIKGVDVTSDSTVELMMTTQDVVKTHVAATVKGARVVSVNYTSDGGCELTMEVPMFGVTNSVASAVMEKPAVKETFPEPVASVAPSAPTSVSVNVTVGQGTTTPSATTPSTQPSVTQPTKPTGSSAAAAPVGSAVGGYTGLIVDCRGLGLKPVMSPVIKNANGQAIYGYKNLDYDKVVSNGMAGYTTDMGRATRAGSNPLVVKAVSLDNHNGNPVISVADANRVLIENGATGFLDATNVVFVR